MAGTLRNSSLTVFYLYLSLLFLSGFLLTGCGGGSSGEQLPTKMLRWNPPTSYADSTPLNPTYELDSYEIYVKESGNFSDTDSAMASLSATNNSTGQITTSFNLANLSPFISKEITYFVSVRAVAKNGLKSNFSPSATFSY